MSSTLLLTCRYRVVERKDMTHIFDKPLMYYMLADFILRLNL